MSVKGPYKVQQKGDRLYVEGRDGHRMSTYYVENRQLAEFHAETLNEAHAAGRAERQKEIVEWLRDGAKKLACDSGGDCPCIFCSRARVELSLADELERQ